MHANISFINLYCCCCCSDPDYKKFLESFNNPEVPAGMTIKDALDDVEAKMKERLAAQNSETPLLAYINKFKEEKRRMQEVVTN